MSAITLDLLKAHVHADDFAMDDAYLAHLLDAALSYVWRAIGQSEHQVREQSGGDVPADIVQAVLLIAGHWYNQREAVAAGGVAEVPYTIGALLKPFQKLTSEEE